MDRYKRTVVPFLVLAGLFAFAIVFGRWYHRWMMEIRLDTLKPGYYHYEFVEIRLRARDPEISSIEAGSSPLLTEVRRMGQPVSTIGGLERVAMRWDSSEQAFIGRWPCPWNAPEGNYDLSLIAPPEIQERLKVRSFRILRRKPNPMPRKLVVLTLESSRPFSSMKVRTPTGAVAGWQGLLDWVQYVGADAFWILGGQTPGLDPEDFWLRQNLGMIPKVAKECQSRGIKFGVYAQCYLTMSNERLSRYRYAEEVEDGHSVFTRAISLADTQRPKDIIALLKGFKAIPGLSYVGLDYIRNALGGYELIDDFMKEMSWINRPEQWDRMSREQRLSWFSKKKISRKDERFIDAWQWWRAHRVALIVHQIHRELGWDTPLWAFTLTWEKGWHHGQDPVMMNDAGVDYDALMLYEANSAQFERMMRDWHAYVRRGDVQLVVGDVIDWPLHQRSPKGPQEFVYRMDRSIDRIYQDGPAEGLFFHDLGRALWGRLGPYSTLDWMRAAKSVVTRFHSSASRSALASPGTPKSF